MPSFRALYHLLEEYQDRPEHASAYSDVLLPWQPYALEAMSVLRVYGESDARRLTARTAGATILSGPPISGGIM